MADNKILPFRKMAVVTDGKLTKLYWQHPDATHNEDIDLESVMEVWRGFGGKPNDISFLKSRGYSVIADGVELKLD